MKLKLLGFLLLGALAFNSCTEDEIAAKYFEVNGSKKELSVGTIDEYSAEGNLKRFDIVLKNSSTSPDHYIKFGIYSTSTSKLEDGTYTYTYINYAPGTFSWTGVGYDLNSDHDGKELSELSYDYAGTIVVTKVDSDYKFVFDLTAEKDGVTTTIKGEYTGYLDII